MRLLQSFMTLIGLAPSGEGEQNKVQYWAAWARGAVFGLALIVAISILATSIIWLVNMVAPIAIAGFAARSTLVAA